ncbi:MAG: flippase-like domain-containing protein [Ignavibacteria bacterium]|jgi:uncharacterized protein (TIRG00374 family)|nr:flippase-like domain-containing protein [Ignavibacteria bacterium]
MNEKLKTTIKYSFTIILIIASAYLALKDVELIKLYETIVSANYLWVLLPVPVILLSHWVRALRWKTMLSPIIKSASTWNLFSAVMIGYAANNVIPRGGELLRPYVVSKREKISFSSTFATIVVERIIDVIALILIFAAVFFFFREQIVNSLPELDANKIVLPTIVFALALLVSLYPPIVRFLLKTFIKPFSKKYFEELNKIFDKFTKGFEVIRSPKQYLRLTYESILIWLFYTIPLYIMFFAFDFKIDYALGFDDAILLIVVSGIGTAIAPTPGAVGVFHFLITNTMVRLYGIAPEIALAYATVTHGINYLIQVIPGALFFLRENIKKIPKKEDLNSM